MTVLKRLSIVGAGSLISFYGWSQLGLGVAFYANHYSQTIYSAGVVAAGGLLALCGLVPNSLVVWLIKLQTPAAKRRDAKARHGSAGERMQKRTEPLQGRHEES